MFHDHYVGSWKLQPPISKWDIGRFCSNERVKWCKIIDIQWDDFHWNHLYIHFSQPPLGDQCYKILSSSSQVPWWLVRLFGVGLRDTMHTYLYYWLRDSMIWLCFLGSIPKFLMQNMWKYWVQNFLGASMIKWTKIVLRYTEIMIFWVKGLEVLTSVVVLNNQLHNIKLRSSKLTIESDVEKQMVETSFEHRFHGLKSFEVGVFPCSLDTLYTSGHHHRS